MQPTPNTSQMFQRWGRRYLNCQAAHSSVSCVYDTSCVFVSYNAHRFRCGVLTQEVKCLLTQIYMVESALHKVCAGWAIIKTNEPATAAACKSELFSPSLFKCFQPFTVSQPVVSHLPLFFIYKASLSSYLSHAAMCLSPRKWRFLHIFIHLIRSQSRARARRWITCGLDIVPQNLYTVGSAEIRPQDWRWAFWQRWLADWSLFSLSTKFNYPHINLLEWRMEVSSHVL